MVSHRHRLLRCATVVLPIAFVIGINLLTLIAFESLHDALGFALLFAVSFPIAMVFSWWVFRKIEQGEARTIEHQKQMSILETVASEAATSLRLEQVLQTGIDCAVEVSGAEGGLVCLLSPDRSELHHTAHTGIPEDMLGPLKKVKLADDAIGARVIRTGLSVRVPDTTQIARDRPLGRTPRFRSVTSIPLKQNGVVNGVMALVSKKAGWSDGVPIQFLEILASQFASADDRAKRNERAADLAVLEERERIAREMHDGLAQVLGYINAKTSAISKLVRDGRQEAALSEIDDIRQASREIYSDVRESILGLRLAGSSEGSLSSNLREYAESFSDLSDIPVALIGFEGVHESDVERAVEIQAMRIVQEALTNVRKHADASRVSLTVKPGAEALELIVEDDGAGFDVSSIEGDAGRHWGLQTMRERALSIGGKFAIVSRPGDGTRVTVTMPARIPEARS